jgi:hypothetical protein
LKAILSPLAIKAEKTKDRKREAASVGGLFNESGKAFEKAFKAIVSKQSSD